MANWAGPNPSPVPPLFFLSFFPFLSLFLSFIFPWFTQTRGRVAGLGPPPDQPPATDLVSAAIGDRLPSFLSFFPLFLSSFFLFLLLCSSSFSLGNGKAGRGRSVGPHRTPPRCRWRSSLIARLGEPVGTLPGPNQAADRLGSTARGRPPSSPPSLHSGRLERSDTPPPLPLRPPRGAEHSMARLNNGRRSRTLLLSISLFASLFLSHSLSIRQWKGGLSAWIDSDGWREETPLSLSFYRGGEGGGMEKEGAARRCVARMLHVGMVAIVSCLSSSLSFSFVYLVGDYTYGDIL